ncbi:GNAT family N-acetyltransferase [Allohahella marinimesophila]|uniref:N-acetyltransferase domain-containing protein n=1 Tax=Allohahella marinimesophila TaxID=1054972 RepID=A0ABP7NME2_9GAMM
MLSYTKIIERFDDEPDLKLIRQEVFVEEQACPPDLEWDELDAVATHFIVRTDEHEPVATARLIPLEQGAASLGRYAVRKHFRGQGIAAKLLSYTIAYARSQGFSHLQLSAQIYAARLYEAEGFVREGEPYEEAGIPHIRMTKLLTGRQQAAAGLLGDDPTVHRFSKTRAYAEAVVSLASQARYRLLLLTPDLEKGVMDQPALLDQFVRLIRDQPRNHIRIICADDKAAVQQSNRLAALGQRMTSSLEIRTLRRDIPFPDQVYLIADQSGILLRHDHRAPAGFICYHDPGLVRRLSDAFTLLWESSEENREIKPLTL